MEASMDGMAILDAESRYVYVNEAHADIYGYDDPEAFVGESWRMCYDEDQIEGLRAEVRSAPDRDGQWRGEAIGRRRDGSEFLQEVSLAALPTGESIYVVRDITERKERERRRQENEQYRRRLYEITTDAKLSADERLREALALGCEYLGVETGFLTRIEAGTQHIVEAYSRHEAIRRTNASGSKRTWARRSSSTTWSTGRSVSPIGPLASGSSRASNWRSSISWSAEPRASSSAANTNRNSKTRMNAWMSSRA
jgi:PAS domain S-box-containing protein